MTWGGLVAVKRASWAVAITLMVLAAAAAPARGQGEPSGNPGGFSTPQMWGGGAIVAVILALGSEYRMNRRQRFEEKQLEDKLDKSLERIRELTDARKEDRELIKELKDNRKEDQDRIRGYERALRLIQKNQANMKERQDKIGSEVSEIDFLRKVGLGPQSGSGEVTYKASVLLVEDDPATFRLMMRILMAGGYNVYPCSTLQGALDMLARCPDFIVLDVRLPDGDGMDVATAAREKCPRAEVFITTGITDALDRYRLAGIPEQNVYLKPDVDIPAMVARMDRVVGERAATQFLARGLPSGP